MATDNKFEYVELDDPNRCQQVHGMGQCRYKREENSQYCPMHRCRGQNAQVQAKMTRMYQLGKWQSTVDTFADEDQIKSLRGEIGVLRMILQETIGSCTSSHMLLLHAGKISEMVTKIEKVVTSCHRLESHMGLLLGKDKVLTLAAVIVEIISSHVKDEDTIAAISNQICQAILEQQK